MKLFGYFWHQKVYEAGCEAKTDQHLTHCIDESKPKQIQKLKSNIKIIR